MFGIYENRLACRHVGIGILREQRSSGSALLKRLSTMYSSEIIKNRRTGFLIIKAHYIFTIFFDHIIPHFLIKSGSLQMRPAHELKRAVVYIIQIDDGDKSSTIQHLTRQVV